MRRLFIMRKDLNMSAGKLAAQVGHCAEAYWTNLIRNCYSGRNNDMVFSDVVINKEEYDGYINDRFVKTVCEARNLNHLLKAKAMAEDMGLKEFIDFGLINDACLTELEPENENGTTTTGIWFKPLEDDVAHLISKKYQLYK